MHFQRFATFVLMISALVTLGSLSVPIHAQQNYGCLFRTFLFSDFSSLGSFSSKMETSACIAACDQHGNNPGIPGYPLTGRPGRCWQFAGPNGSNPVEVKTYTDAVKCQTGVYSYRYPGTGNYVSQADAVAKLTEELRKAVRGGYIDTDHDVPSIGLSTWLNINGCDYSSNSRNVVQLYISVKKSSQSPIWEMIVKLRLAPWGFMPVASVAEAQLAVASVNMTGEQHEACREGKASCPIDPSLYAYYPHTVGGSYTSVSVLDDSFLMFADYQLKEAVRTAVQNHGTNTHGQPVSLLSSWTRTPRGYTTCGSYFSRPGGAPGDLCRQPPPK
jgi:hypothetical protein